MLISYCFLTVFVLARQTARARTPCEKGMSRCWEGWVVGPPGGESPLSPGTRAPVRNGVLTQLCSWLLSKPKPAEFCEDASRTGCCH